MIARTPFLDLNFHSLTPNDVQSFLRERSGDEAFVYVVTPNVDHVVRFARSGPAVRRAYEEAPLLICDSRVLSRLARLVGVHLPVVTGSDLTCALFTQIAARGDRICLIGASPEDALRLHAHFPDFVIDHYDAPSGLRDDAAARAKAVAYAVEAQCRFTLLAVGSPQQEMIAWEIAQDPRARGTALCIGASIDFLIGTQKRAPKLLQRAGLEWAWRLVTQPRRLAKRYLIDCPAIFPLVWKWRLSNSHAPNSIVASKHEQPQLHHPSRR